MTDEAYLSADETEAWLEELAGLMEDAPETVTRDYITDFNLPEGDAVWGVVELGDGTYGSLSYGENMFSFTNGGYPEPESLGTAMGKKQIAGKFRMTEEEAVEASDKILKGLGIIGMTPQSIEKACFYPQTSIFWTEEVPVSKGYWIEYVREIGGIQTQLGESWNFDEGQKYAYTPPWEYESVYVYIDEYGNMQQFSWFNPSQVTDKVSDNAELMPFPDIQERMRIELGNTLSEEMKAEGKLSVAVDRIELKMAMVNSEDDPDEALFVPAWYIHYTVNSAAEYTDENGEPQTEPAKNEQLMILNALDGGTVSTVSQAVLQRMNGGSAAVLEEDPQAPAQTETDAQPVPAEAAQEA
jgi:hypothetical protein